MTVEKNSTDFYQVFIDKETAEIGQFKIGVMITELDSGGDYTNKTIDVEAIVIDTETLG